jgi:hypothetical protein
MIDNRVVVESGISWLPADRGAAVPFDTDERVT